MTRLWFTADLHLGHRMVAESRGYTTTTEHDDAIAAEWDKTVHEGDHVWLLGDLTLGGQQKVHDALYWVSERPGVKHLISGNHDQTHPMHRTAYRHMDEWRDTAFESVQERQYRKLHGHRVLLSHFPYLGDPNGDHTTIERFGQWRFPPNDPGKWIVHGHTHSKLRCAPQWRSVHVGWDAWGTLVESRTVAGMIDEYGDVSAAFGIAPPDSVEPVAAGVLL